MFGGGIFGGAYFGGFGLFRRRPARRIDLIASVNAIALPASHETTALVASTSHDATLIANTGVVELSAEADSDRTLTGVV